VCNRVKIIHLEWKLWNGHLLQVLGIGLNEKPLWKDTKCERRDWNTHGWFKAQQINNLLCIYNQTALLFFIFFKLIGVNISRTAQAVCTSNIDDVNRLYIFSNSWFSVFLWFQFAHHLSFPHNEHHMKELLENHFWFFFFLSTKKPSFFFSSLVV
jgi:hypothetical protein